MHTRLSWSYDEMFAKLRGSYYIAFGNHWPQCKGPSRAVVIVEKVKVKVKLSPCLTK
jgi:hypothetical protein